MYCASCGKLINDAAAICVHCGVATNKFKQANRPFLGFIFSFLIPLAGLIISIIEFVKAKNQGDNASLALAGIIISSVRIGLSVLWILYMVSLF